MNLVICSLLLSLIVITDIKHKYVYEGMSLLGALIGIDFQLYQGNITQAIIGLNIGILLVFIINIVRVSGKLGGGDAKTMGMVGAFLGWLPVIFVAMLSYILCGAYRRIKHNYETIAFTPFIAIATVMVIICQSAIFYLKN